MLLIGLLLCFFYFQSFFLVYLFGVVSVKKYCGKMINAIIPIAINNELIDPPLLNINGDIAASALAVSLQADKLIFLTDVDGVLDENSKLISTLNTAQSKSLISNGTAKSGMIPKINSCIDAVESNVESFIINGTKYGNLTSIIKNSESVGTKFLV